MEEVLKLKEEGNEAFKINNWNNSIELYTKAINLIKNNYNHEKELAILLKNRAASYLKLNENLKVIDDCNQCLNITINDPKALYRRLQAYENLKRYEEAYNDATTLFKNDPNNKFIQPILEKLHKIVQENVKENSKTTSKINNMMNIIFNNQEQDKEKRLNAVNNLVVLAKENSGAELILKTDLVKKLKQLIGLELRNKNHEIVISSIRILSELCKNNVERVNKVLKEIDGGIDWFLQLLYNDDEKLVNLIQYCIQTVINTYAGLEKNTFKPNKEMLKKYDEQLNEILTKLTINVNNRLISGLARDAIIELIMRNTDHTVLDWCEKFLEIGGLERLLDCASELLELKYESSLNITNSTNTITSVCLSKIYENMYYDEAKKKYYDRIEQYINDKLITQNYESKLLVINLIIALLKGPLDIGNMILSKNGIIEMILVMTNSDDLLQQKLSIECIIEATNKIDKAKIIIQNGINILKNLYQNTKNDSIRIRALVGLCKLASSGGNDVTLKPFNDQSYFKLMESCQRFLLNPNKDHNLRKWSAEGLSYLTLNAEVKEKLINNPKSIETLIELANSGDQSCVFAIVTILINLTNSYDKQEVIPEMIELAKFAKQHIPEEHEFDKPNYVINRIITLGNLGITTALVSLSKTQSPSLRELIARVFNALCSEHELRGLVVQQGGVKALIQLALNLTSDKGKKQASQALSRISITINPEVAFPGQRSLEVVRPILTLLHPDCSGLENFEALMALCNLAQLNETTRERILNEGGLSKIEHYMYEDHQYICRAATQCITNMTMSPKVIDMFSGNNDKIKYLVSLCLEDDADTSMAASGALAILTGSSKRCCEKIFDSKNWLDCMHLLLATNVVNLRYRGVCIVKNIIENSKELTEKLMETDIMEVLMALTKLSDKNQVKVIDVANEALKLAENHGVIKRTE